MKTTKSLSQIAAHFRATGEKAKSKSFQYTAKEVNAEIIRQETTSQLRISVRLNKTSVREQMQRRIVIRLQKIAEALPSTGYSMGDIKKAQFATLEAKSDTRSFYSQSSGYRGSERHGSVIIKFNITELLKLRVIGGLITIVDEKVARRIYKCRTLVRNGTKQHFNIGYEEMFLTSTFHAKSIQEIIEWRKNQAKRLMDERIAKQAQQEFQRHFEAAKMMFYGLHHSLESGNCEAGSLNFCGDKGLNKEYGYRGDFLLSLGNGRTQYVQRMITNRAIQLQKISSK